MATPGEKKALLFLSLVAVLGSAVRLVSAYQVPLPSADERGALEGQIRAVDSVRRGQGGRGRAKGGGGGRGESRRTRAKRGSDSTPGHLPPSPPPMPTPWLPAASDMRPPVAPVDLNVAVARELETLPGIGRALARRIVAARDSAGPFQSLEDVTARVRGVGPTLAKRLAAAVTFSGPHRPPSAERTEPFGNGGTATRANRRRSH